MEAQPMRLQDLRLKEGMSLEQLAELSGVDHDRLVMFENNPGNHTQYAFGHRSPNCQSIALQRVGAPSRRRLERRNPLR